MTDFSFTIDGNCNAARAATLSCPSGTAETPLFMPVGTRATVKGLSPTDLRNSQARIVLANTYHLHLAPGEQTIKALGGLHRFMSWDGPILTDSGGFQVFSLEGLRTVNDDGVTFRSHLDGSLHHLTPESVVDIQWALGPDIAMAFDHVVPGDVSHTVAADALARTTRWLERCLQQHRTITVGQPTKQTLWPILQGGVFDDLRRQALSSTLDLNDWTGIAVGGLAVGETKQATLRVLEQLEPSLPKQIPRYLMGVGFPEDLLSAIARGVDLFDCVVPTRNGRHGTAFTPDGTLSIKKASHRTDAGPLVEDCTCEACTQYSRGYLRHLFVVGEMLGLRLVSLHNVHFLIDLANQARQHILDGTFDGWHLDWIKRYHARGVL